MRQKVQDAMDSIAHTWAFELAELDKDELEIVRATCEKAIELSDEEFNKLETFDTEY